MKVSVIFSLPFQHHVSMKVADDHSLFSSLIKLTLSLLLFVAFNYN